MASNELAGAVAGAVVATGAAGAAGGKVEVDEALSIFASLMRDTARAWSTSARQAEAASIQACASTPVANCAAEYASSGSMMSIR